MVSPNIYSQFSCPFRNCLSSGQSCIYAPNTAIIWQNLYYPILIYSWRPTIAFTWSLSHKACNDLCTLTPPVGHCKSERTGIRFYHSISITLLCKCPSHYRQVTHICERMVKERTEQLCDEYDKVLASKLAEQYEAFLKFNHDQIQRQFSTSEAASCKCVSLACLLP